MIVAGARLFVGGKDRDHALRIEIAHELFGPRAQAFAVPLIYKLFEHQESVAFVSAFLSAGEFHSVEHSQMLSELDQVNEEHHCLEGYRSTGSKFEC